MSLAHNLSSCAEPGSDFFIANVKQCAALRGWDRATKKTWPTLTRMSLEEAWGFSLMVGNDLGEVNATYSGVVARKRGDFGLWCKVL